MRLRGLIRALGEIDDIEWVRVMYAYPTHISDAFLAAIAETPKAVKYLDMPLQHASRNVLKLMKRGGNRESLERLIARVREKVPGIAIRTTFITGFPGETEEDFEELMAFVRNCRFDNLGVFTYSDEEGTPAFDLPDKVDPKIAKQRRNRLMKEQAKISKQLNKAKIGNTYKVMFEGLSQESDLLFQGRLEGQTQEIDGYILINDMPEDLEPQIGGDLRRSHHRGSRIRSGRRDRLDNQIALRFARPPFRFACPDYKDSLIILGRMCRSSGHAEGEGCGQWDA